MQEIAVELCELLEHPVLVLHRNTYHTWQIVISYRDVFLKIFPTHTLSLTYTRILNFDAQESLCY